MRGKFRKIRRDEKGFTGLEAAIVLIAFVVVAAVFSYVMLGAGFYTTQKSKRVVDTGVHQASSSLTLDGQYIYMIASRESGGETGSNGKVSEIYFYVTQTAGGTPVDLEKTSIAITTEQGYKQLFFEDLVEVDDTVYVISGQKSSGDVVDVSSNTTETVTDVSGYVRVGSTIEINTSKPAVYNGTIENIIPIFLQGKNQSYVPSVGIVVNHSETYYTIAVAKPWWYEATVSDDNDNVVEQNEKYKIILAVNVNSTAWNEVWGSGSTPEWEGIGDIQPGDTIVIEVRPPIGAPLTITKTLPPSFEDLTYV